MNTITVWVSKARQVLFWAKESAVVSSTLVFAFFFLAFLYIYLPGTTLSAGDDHYFHFRFAEMMQDKGFLQSFADFKSIYFSKMAEGTYFVYYNFLFYLVILPFSAITPLYLGIKLYAIVAASLVITGIYAILRYFRVSHAWWWLLAVASLVSVDSLWRMFLSRPYVLAPLFLLTLIVCIHARSRTGVALVSVCYLLWYYASFFFPIIVAGFYVMFEKFYTGRWEFRYLLTATLSIGAVLLTYVAFAPGFLAYMHDIIFGAVSTVGGNVLPEGAELYPIDIIEYVAHNTLIIAATVVAVALEVGLYIQARRGEEGNEGLFRLAPVRATLLFTAISCFAAAALVTGRFKDYLFPLLAVYLILFFSDWLRQAPLRQGGRAFATGLCIAIVYLGGTSLVSLDTFLANNGSPIQVFEGVGGWLNKNTEPGSVVFNTDWSWFSQLYYYAPNDNYVVGLEPRFLFVYDERLFWLWGNIVRYGGVCETNECTEMRAAAFEARKHPDEADAWYKQSGDAIARVLTEDFHSKYVVSSYQYSSLNAVLDHNKHFKKVYGGNRAYYIYEVTP